MPRVAPLMAIFGGLLALQGAMALGDNSFLTHLATGRVILDSGLPRSNPFLYTGTSFPVPSYLWSIVLAVVDSAAGATGLKLLTTAVAGLLGVLVVRLATTPANSNFMGKRSDPGLLTIVTAVVLTWFCLISFISARPHLPGFVLLALTVLVWKERRSAWLLLPIFAIWVNVHGTWLYGLAVLGMFVVAEAIDERKLTRRDFGLLATALAGIVLGGGLYPDRFAVVLLPSRQFGNPVEREALALYNEWRPVQVGDPQLWIMIGLALIAGYGCLRNRRYAMTGAVAALVFLGLSGFRMLPIVAIALVPLAALGLEQIGSIKLPTGRTAKGLNALGLVVALLAVGVAFKGRGYDLSAYPVAAVDWLEARDAIGGDVRTVSHEYVGNYLEWRFGAEANTYVDDRPDAETFIAYVSMLSLGSNWQQALEEADGDVIIWNSKLKLVDKLEHDPNWVKATTQGKFTVFCSREMAPRCT
ncbi:MAG: hypothetical protein WBF71_00170 [Microthrixaceae bacterium]